MNGELSRVSILENTYAYIGRASNESNFKTFKEEIEKHLNIIKRVLDSDIDKLTDDEFFNLLMGTYSITLDTEDYLKLLSKKYHKKYIFVGEIPTTMTFTGRATEGHGRSFSWWPQLYQVGYDAAISRDMDYEYNKVYTKEEVNKLVSDKSVVLLTENHKPVDNIDFKEETFTPFSINDKFNIDGNTLSGFTLNNYNLYIKYLKRKFTKKKILMDIKKYAIDLQKDIDSVTKLSNQNDSLYSELTKLCNDWYESSEAKNKFLLLQRKLNKERD